MLIVSTWAAFGERDLGRLAFQESVLPKCPTLSCLVCVSEVALAKGHTRLPAAVSVHLQIPERSTRCKTAGWQQMRFAFQQKQTQGGSAFLPTHRQPNVAQLQQS